MDKTASETKIKLTQSVLPKFASFEELLSHIVVERDGIDWPLAGFVFHADTQLMRIDAALAYVELLDLSDTDKRELTAILKGDA